LRKSAKKLQPLSYERKRKLRVSSRSGMATIALRSSRTWSWYLHSKPQPKEKEKDAGGGSQEATRRAEKKATKTRKKA
jgi:hypothetical protein